MSTHIDSTVGLSRLIHNASALQVFNAVVALIIIRWFARGFYRAYFHPLARFPGPKISAATRIPQIVATWTGSSHLYVARLHRQYGPIVRISPDHISFIDSQAWKDTSGHATAEQKKQRGSMPTKHWSRYGRAVNGTPSLINQQSDKEHARMRRVFNPAFSDRALKQQEPLFMKWIDLLVSKLDEGIQEDSDRKWNMVRMYNFTTFDVMGDLTFGEPLNMLNSGKYDPWVSMIFGSVRTNSKLSIIQYYPLLYKAFKALVPETFAKKRYEHFQYSVERVTKRLERGRRSEGVDLWDLVLKQDDGKVMSRAEMDSNSSLFMIAGTETTATLLSGLTYQLLKNPDKMEKLVEEIRSTFADSRDMHMEALAALPYLNACMKEALRVYPPVPVGLPRMTPPDGSTIAGVYVPPDTTVTIPHLAMYTSELNFKDPLSFVPERWLGDERYANDDKHALQPFSVGPRDCLGKNMAYHEMRLIAAKVFYKFDFELCPESDKWNDQEVFTLWEKHPLMCKLKPATSS
ncbi:cytochrome P450 [Lophiotrema nucula]|uniref:Cytochrome P450 n=1 Tax=Lophiotrema nucula TaxID=690887 RepID=A0A6A5YWS0_9PLEO|nr:cytochrome P450 [Lophiotrema nucula]